MIIVIIDEDTHEARRIAIKAKDSLGGGLVIFTAESPASAASMLADLTGGKEIPLLDRDASESQIRGSRRIEQ